jgi:hypothetical protein
MTVERFFFTLLPTLVHEQAAHFGGMSGRLSFHCAGDGYTVQLGNVTEPVVRGFDPRADVCVWFFGDAFDRFVRGEALVGKKDRVLKGDPAVLERFGALLQPSHSSLSVRFASVAARTGAGPARGAVVPEPPLPPASRLVPV